MVLTRFAIPVSAPAADLLEGVLDALLQVVINDFAVFSSTDRAEIRVAIGVAAIVEIEGMMDAD